MRPLGAELFHGDRQTDGRTDGHTDRHDEAKSPFFVILRPRLRKKSLKLWAKKERVKKW